MTSPQCVGLVPARSGSKRIPGKNMRHLSGAPLLYYTVRAALDSGIFTSVIVSTDCEETARAAAEWGATIPSLRPVEFAGDHSPDIEWIQHTLKTLDSENQLTECFSILRPTSPFRTPETIRRAWKTFLENQPADSLRAVEPCEQHPAKMWTIEENRLRSVMANPDPKDTPWHSQPYQSLPPVWVQNASLEIAWSSVALSQTSISGKNILAFLTEGLEGFDINRERDWHYAEYLLNTKAAALPEMRIYR